MTVKEYLKKLGIEESSSLQLTFVVAEYKDSNSTICYYRNTPTNPIWMWFKTKETEKTNNTLSILEYFVLNTEQNQINWMSGAISNRAIKNHYIMSLLVISKKELKKVYSEKQMNDIISYIDKKIEKNINTNPFLQK